MAGYISEFKYYGDTSEEFVEVALPVGTDPSGYKIYIYQADGTVLYSFPLGSAVATMAGHDVYVIDASSPGFDDGGSDPTGNFYPDDAVALVDGSGTVQQFTSYWGSTATAVEGPANGMTSTDAGTASNSGSLQSDNGGSSYYSQSATNPGTIPACYAAGSQIATPAGQKAVETIVPGDLILTEAGRAIPVRWVWTGAQALDAVAKDKRPVLIRQGALGENLPSVDLVVSGQHRIVVGAHGQLENAFDAPQMVPAKALTGLVGISYLKGARAVIWHHILCDEHSVIFANGLASETLLLGTLVIESLDQKTLAELSRAINREISAGTDEPPVLPCLTVGQTRQRLRRFLTGPSQHPFKSRPARSSGLTSV